MHEYIVNTNIDILSLTETWLDCDKHSSVIPEVLPSGYRIQAITRPDGRQGGGIALIYRECMKLKILQIDTLCTTFEKHLVTVQIGNLHFTLMTVYRPPPSPSNKLKIADFYVEWPLLLDELNSSTHKVIIVGDINIHLDEFNKHDTSKFLSMIKSVGMLQHVDKPTHKSGHILDVVITRESDNIIVGPVQVNDPPLMYNSSGTQAGDHSVIVFNVRSRCKQTPVKENNCGIP